MTNMITKVINRLDTARMSAATLLRKVTRKSDYKRWGNNKELSPSWDERTKRLARLIEPESSVIEFGAGRLVLKKHLPKNCLYTPSDLVDRGNGTIVCDLNSKRLPRMKSYDVAVFSGVLEYVNDVPRLIEHLSGCVNTIAISYAVTEANSSNRREQGWVNDYSSEKIIDIFQNAGFQCVYDERWRGQMIYKFCKR